jgi:hypothetical protein
MPNTSLSDLLAHSRFHSMLFALPGYQFPYTVMNRCLYLRAEQSIKQQGREKGRALPRHRRSSRIIITCMGPTTLGWGPQPRLRLVQIPLHSRPISLSLSLSLSLCCSLQCAPSWPCSCSKRLPLHTPSSNPNSLARCIPSAQSIRIAQSHQSALQLLRLC